MLYNHNVIVDIVRCFMNIKGRMKKLQTAIIKKGFIVKINTCQFYSADQGRMITCYKVLTPITYFSSKKLEWKITDYEIISSCSIIDIIMCLLDIYKAVSEWQES